MSIFGKTDADLPLVTQASQIDYENPEEVRLFYVRCASHYRRYKRFDFDNQIPIKQFEDDIFAESENELRYWEESFPPTSNEAKNMSAGSVMLKIFAETCGEVRVVMKGAVIDRIHEETFKKIRERITGHYQPNTLNPDRNSVPDEFGLLTSRDYFPSEIFYAIYPWVGLSVDLNQVMFDRYIGRAAVLECIECQSPFVTYRRVQQAQQYCSHRCATRAGQRRRRAKNAALHKIA